MTDENLSREVQLKSTALTEATEMAKGVLEVGIDSLLVNGFFKDIPGVNMVFGAAKGIQSMRDAADFMRVKKFIESLNLQTPEQIMIMKEKFFKLEDYDKIGSHLFLSLSQTIIETKIEWKANILTALIDLNVHEDNYFRIMDMIDRCYAADVIRLPELFQNHSISVNYIRNVGLTLEDELVLKNMEQIGITELVYIQEDVDAVDAFRDYRPSVLGHMFYIWAVKVPFPVT